MYSHTIGPRNIYRFNFHTSLLEQLTFDDGSNYPIYLSGLNKIGFVKNNYAEYWLMDPDGQNQQYYFSLPTPNLNYQIYCAETDKIYYYSKESTRRIAVMDYNGQNFQYLTDVNNNACPVINNSGDSLIYHSDRTGVHNIYLLDLQSLQESRATFNNSKSCPILIPRINSHLACLLSS